MGHLNNGLHNLEQVAVIGAGTMGRGIAMSFANAGIAVTLVDLSEEVRQAALTAIESTYAQMVKRERISAAEAEQRLARFTLTGDYAQIADVDLAIEAVYENLQLKQKIFQQLDQTLKAEAILASNTSYLDIDALAQVTQRPQQVLGLHFFSPAHIMKLLEIVRGADTRDDVITQAQQLAERIGKIAVVAGNGYGFIGNRMLKPYVFQARRLLLEGAQPAQVDAALEAFGMAMGPFRMYDVVGVDLEWRMRQLSGEQPPAGSDAALNLLVDDELCAQERFGQKVGRGYYRYEAGSRAALPDPEVEALVTRISTAQGFERRGITADEIVERCLLALINEGFKVLGEGIAASPEDIDTVYLNGYGFPRERGGPMSYARAQGLAVILGRLQVLEAQLGDFWTPAAELVRRAS